MSLPLFPLPLLPLPLFCSVDDELLQSSSATNAKTFLEKHRDLISQQRQIKALQEELTTVDLEVEKLLKRKIRTQKCLSNAERMQKLLDIEEKRFTQILRNAKVCFFFSFLSHVFPSHPSRNSESKFQMKMTFR